MFDDQTSVLFITLEKQLDYTGATLVNAPICENELASPHLQHQLKM
jgi:hypothetical protein